MHNIGVIGDSDSVMGFGAFGLAVRCCIDVTEARQALNDMADFAVVFITDALFGQLMMNDTARQDSLLPITVPIPDGRSDGGLGEALVKSRIIRAVGADISEESGAKA